jgi:hypothetical protein
LPNCSAFRKSRTSPELLVMVIGAVQILRLLAWRTSGMTYHLAAAFPRQLP